MAVPRPSDKGNQWAHVCTLSNLLRMGDHRTHFLQFDLLKKSQKLLTDFAQVVAPLFFDPFLGQFALLPEHPDTEGNQQKAGEENGDEKQEDLPHVSAGVHCSTGSCSVGADSMPTEVANVTKLSREGKFLLAVSASHDG